MDHETYLTALREESEHFLETLVDVPAGVPVPSCPGWTAADLVWHLGEVQHFWARVVAEGLDEGSVVPPERPEPHDLATFTARAGTELLTALHEAGPDRECWSWHDDGGTSAWVARRQAHEALVHRVDAELTVNAEVRPPSVELAVDGVDEVLRTMIDGVPDWGTFTPDGRTVRLECSNADAAWVLALGRFTGTGPDSGTDYDLDAAAVLSEDEGGTDDLVVRGAAWDLDRWLWGRGEDGYLQVTGDRALLERLRRLVAEATQ